MFHVKTRIASGFDFAGGIAPPGLMADHTMKPEPAGKRGREDSPSQLEGPAEQPLRRGELILRKVPAATNPERDHRQGRHDGDEIPLPIAKGLKHEDRPGTCAEDQHHHEGGENDRHHLLA